MCDKTSLGEDNQQQSHASIRTAYLSKVFHHSVIHGLGFFICFLFCFMVWILRAQNKKTRYFYILYNMVFDQSERAQGLIYILT